ncbi:MAG: tRNA pseudouridine(55) synthase TruB [Deltaproteobacteria bacterium]|nr:tRNA pseudouridine(55) synthase TruB [Deltaproteobacteria bacterium]
MNGIVVVDKAAGMTSAQVVAKVKRILRAKKVGHCGTLDPFATGVLVCCINQATRLAQFFSHGKKGYEAVMRLGIRTDTQDLTGRIVSREPTLAVADHEIGPVFRRFLNVREQAPPAFSALKHHGVPLYKLARRGTFVQKPSRRISIYDLAVLDVDLPYVRFRVSCSQGTYIRTLCADMGDALGCGAHLVQLRRTESSGFTLEETISLQGMERLAATGEVSNCVIPMSNALKGIPEIQASQGLARRIRHGEPVTEEKLGPVDATGALWVKVTDADRNLIAVLGSRERKGVLPYVCVFPDPDKPEAEHRELPRNVLKANAAKHETTKTRKGIFAQIPCLELFVLSWLFL